MKYSYKFASILFFFVFSCSSIEYTKNFSEKHKENLKDVSLHIGYEYYLEGKLYDDPINNYFESGDIYSDINHIILEFRKNRNIENVELDSVESKNEIQLFVKFDNRTNNISSFLSLISFSLIPSVHYHDIIIEAKFTNRINKYRKYELTKIGKQRIYFGIFQIFYRPFRNPNKMRKILIQDMVNDIILEIKDYNSNKITSNN